MLRLGRKDLAWLTMFYFVSAKKQKEDKMSILSEIRELFPPEVADTAESIYDVFDEYKEYLRKKTLKEGKKKEY